MSAAIADMWRIGWKRKENVTKLSVHLDNERRNQAEQKKSDENKMINFEIYQYNNELYCIASFSFTDKVYSAKLSTEISEQVKKLKTEE